MKSSTKHWTFQRLSAILLIPLSFWLINFLHLCFQENYLETSEWLTSSLNQCSVTAWFLIVFYHAALGIQVVLEDYVSNQKIQRFSIWLTYAIFSSLALSAILVLFSR